MPPTSAIPHAAGSGRGIASIPGERKSPSSSDSQNRPAPAFASTNGFASAVSALHTLQALHSTLRPHLPALIGVSGGRDSVALLHFLISRGWSSLVVCHLNHGLRGHESAQDANFVRRLAKDHGLVCEVHPVRIEALAKRAKLSIETCARAERDAFFHRMAKQHGTPFVFLAHHAEDQAETILGNLCRGSGLHGLSGMAISAADRDGLIKLRPLLQVRREDIDACVETHRLAFREDSSNASAQYRRNRLRHEVLPLLREICQRDVVDIMARCARFAGRDEAFLRETALRLAQEEGIWEADGALRVSPALKASHPAIQARVLRHWLVKILKLKAIGSHEIEGLLGLLNENGVAKLNLPGDLWVRRKAKRLFVEGLPPLSAATAASLTKAST